jgi:hypothetical protein
VPYIAAELVCRPRGGSSTAGVPPCELPVARLPSSWGCLTDDRLTQPRTRAHSTSASTPPSPRTSSITPVASPTPCLALCRWPATSICCHHGEAPPVSLSSCQHPKWLPHLFLVPLDPLHDRILLPATGIGRCRHHHTPQGALPCFRDGLPGQVAWPNVARVNSGVSPFPFDLSSNISN